MLLEASARSNKLKLHDDDDDSCAYQSQQARRQAMFAFMHESFEAIAINQQTLMR